MTASASTKATPSGLPPALGAYIFWGFVPLFFKLLASVPPLEVLAQRIVWSLPLCIAILLARRQFGEFRAAISNWRIVRVMLLSALLIALNWLIYINAIVTDHVLAASLGFYLNPLVNVLLGVVFLKERLSRLQGLAVAIAAVGVAMLLAGALDTLWISLTLALTFGAYGLIRKLAPVGALPGLAIETSLLFPAATAIAAYYLIAPQFHTGFGDSPSISLLLIASGAVTAIPLLLFAVAARRMSYAALGFVQYLSPTIAFSLSVLVFNEPLKPAQIGCFLLIWTSIAVFSFDIWRKSRVRRSEGRLAAQS